MEMVGQYTDCDQLERISPLNETIGTSQQIHTSYQQVSRPVGKRHDEEIRAALNLRSSISRHAPVSGGQSEACPPVQIRMRRYFRVAADIRVSTARSEPLPDTARNPTSRLECWVARGSFAKARSTSRFGRANSIGIRLLRPMRASRWIRFKPHYCLSAFQPATQNGVFVPAQKNPDIRVLSRYMICHCYSNSRPGHSFLAYSRARGLFAQAQGKARVGQVLLPVSA